MNARGDCLRIELPSGDVVRAGRTIYWRTNSTVMWGTFEGVNEKGHLLVNGRAVRPTQRMRTSLDRVLTDVRLYIREGVE